MIRNAYAKINIYITDVKTAERGLVSLLNAQPGLSSVRTTRRTASPGLSVSTQREATSRLLIIIPITL